MEKVILGKTGIEVSRIGMGVLTVGATQLNLSLEQGAAVISHALNQGINFIDTAQYYETYDYIRLALNNCESKPIICSKCLGHTHSDMEYAIEEALKSLEIDCIDIFLMHEVRPGELRNGAWRALLEAKKAGKVKAIGISTHHVDIVDEYADNQQVDVIFPLINCDGLGIRKGDGTGTRQEMEDAIRKAHDNGIGIFSMKVFGGGHLTGKYMEAMNYVFSLDCVDSVMMGFGKTEEVDTAVKYLNGELSDDFKPDISQKKTYIEPGNCEGCGSCVARCPNKAMYIGVNGMAHVDESLCLTCGYCAPVCPVRAIILI